MLAEADVVSDLEDPKSPPSEDRPLFAKWALPCQHPHQRNLRRHVRLCGGGCRRHRNARGQGGAGRGLRSKDSRCDHPLPRQRSSRPPCRW